MSDKPTISNARVRQKVRAVLNLQPGRPFSDSMIHEAVNELVGGGVDLSQLRDAIDWNHNQAYIRKQYFEEAEMTGYLITKAGIAQESIK